VAAIGSGSMSHVEVVMQVRPWDGGIVESRLDWGICASRGVATRGE